MPEAPKKTIFGLCLLLTWCRLSALYSDIPLPTFLRVLFLGGSLKGCIRILSELVSYNMECSWVYSCSLVLPTCLHYGFYEKVSKDNVTLCVSQGTLQKVGMTVWELDCILVVSLKLGSIRFLFLPLYGSWTPSLKVGCYVYPYKVEQGGKCGGRRWGHS